MPQPISRTRARVNICPESVNTPPPTPRPHFPALEFKSVESEVMIVSLDLDLTILLIFSCSEFNPTESELLDYSQAFKGRVTLPNRMNFPKNSKRPSIPPSFSENYTAIRLKGLRIIE